MFYRPRDGHGLPHDPFKAIVAPRPIGWISTRSRAGAVNLAPYSFFNAIATDPWLVLFAADGDKDSAAFARDSGEFAVNLVGRPQFAAMNASSIAAPRGVSEFALAGVDALPCQVIAAPRVAGAPAVLECRVTEIAEPRDLSGRKAGIQMVIGEVVGVHIDENCLVDGRFDVRRARTVARLGYNDYAEMTELFAAERPR